MTTEDVCIEMEGHVHFHMKKNYFLTSKKEKEEDLGSIRKYLLLNTYCYLYCRTQQLILMGIQWFG